MALLHGWRSDVHIAWRHWLLALLHDRLGSRSLAVEFDIGGGLQRRPIGYNVDDDAARTPVVANRGALGPPALARQLSSSGGQRTECVGAALRQGTRIVVRRAHALGL